MTLRFSSHVYLLSNFFQPGGISEHYYEIFGILSTQLLRRRSQWTPDACIRRRPSPPSWKLGTWCFISQLASPSSLQFAHVRCHLSDCRFG